MKSYVYATQLRSKPFLTLLFVAFSIGLYAQQATISVQGVLTKSDGTAVDDGNDYTLTFRLWNNESSNALANKKHEETINDVSIVGGVYSIVLGINGTPLAAQFNETYWLGVSVGTSNTELLPRPRLTHAPYALGIVGQNNIFPSSGAVIADAYRAKGGPAMGGNGPTSNGFAFQPGGDESGGMYSTGQNNIELYAGGQKRVLLNTTQNEIYGQTVNFGPLVSNNLTVNGNALINNVGNNTGNLTVKSNLQVDGSQTVNGSSTINVNQTINGTSYTKGFAKTNGINSGGGFTFNYPGGIDDTDSGVFGPGDGIVQIRANNTIVAQFTTALPYTNQCCATPSSIKFFGIQKGPDQPQVEWDEVSGQLQVDNSSRRLKRNIQPLTDNYNLILEVQPRLYNRIGYPDSLVEMGYIAEEFDSIGLKRLVHYNSRGEIIGVNYKKVSIYLAEVVKDQHSDIEKMKAEIAALKLENTALSSANAGLQIDNGLLHKQQNVFSAQLDSLSKRMKSLEMVGTGK